MTDKTAIPLAEPIELRVRDKAGVERDYKTSGVDVYRVEKFTGKSAQALEGNYHAIAFMAYSAARRAGDAYRPRKASTSEHELFEAWLDEHDVFVLAEIDDEGDEAGPKDDEAGELESEPTPTSSLDESR